ncbi:hypothetical protein [Christiangramia aquimixticola]|uniref:hypothetical protein n=1 Tax=Christiangramia aquimixticola TaxID=1697558 RepID=UPI003AA9799F
MRKGVFLLLVSVVCFLTSCDTDRDDIKLSQAELIEFRKIVKNGEWKVSKFIENGTAKTNNYDGYSFSFQELNTLIASGNAAEVNGTWSTNRDEGPGYEANKKIYLHLFFGADEKLSNLTNSFIVISASSSEIELEVMDNDSTLLSFRKN